MTNMCLEKTINSNENQKFNNINGDKVIYSTKSESDIQNIFDKVLEFTELEILDKTNTGRRLQAAVQRLDECIYTVKYINKGVNINAKLNYWVCSDKRRDNLCAKLYFEKGEIRLDNYLNEYNQSEVTINDIKKLANKITKFLSEIYGGVFDEGQKVSEHLTVILNNKNIRNSHIILKGNDGLKFKITFITKSSSYIYGVDYDHMLQIMKDNTWHYIACANNGLKANCYSYGTDLETEKYRNDFVRECINYIEKIYY